MIRPVSFPVANTQGALSGLWDPEKSLCKTSEREEVPAQVFPSLQLSFRLEVFQTVLSC